MQLEKASRQKVKIKLALQGASGSGKTMSALLLAYGLCSNWKKVALIETENRSSMLYAHLGEFQVVSLSAPFTPEKYIQAFQMCVAAGVEVVIIDSISHEWEGILEEHAGMAGNSYTNWNKLTPRHNAFVQYILQSPCHVISTIRAKQDYVLTERNGKQVPEKVGLKGVTRDGLDYEFTIVFELDVKQKATATKDRTSLFNNKPPITLSMATGRAILNWCNNEVSLTNDELRSRIAKCPTINDLLNLYRQFPPTEDEVENAFTRRKLELQQQNSQSTKANSNGTYTH